MVEENIVIVGGSSEIAKHFQNLCVEKNLNFLIISSKSYKNHINSEKYLKIDDYLNDSKKIINWLQNKSPTKIIFFNGALFENRPYQFPTKNDIKLTKKINYTIPIYLTEMFNKNLISVNKYIYISSLAAVKPRNKNYIYGGYKKLLENKVKELNLNSFLILRFGKVHTKMSLGHKNHVFSMKPYDAAAAIMDNLNKTNIIYPNKGLQFLSILLFLIPKRVIDFFKI